MMEIVIKIDENVFTRLFDNGTEDYAIANDDLFAIAKSIRKGTPLPEHHGRLGDLDALEEYFRNVRKELKASDYKNGVEFFVRDEMLLNVQQFIHLCDAIIEGSDSE
jgi:hypothetical protein